MIFIIVLAILLVSAVSFGSLMWYEMDKKIKQKDKEIGNLKKDFLGQKNEIQKRKSDDEEEIDHLTDNIKTLKSRLETLKEVKNTRKELIVEQETKLGGLQSLYDDILEEKEDGEEEINQLTKEIDILQMRLDKLKSEREKQKKVILQQESELQEAQKMNAKPRYESIGFTFLTDSTNIYTNEIINSINYLFDEVKKIICKQVFDNLALIKMSMEDEIQQIMNSDDESIKKTLDCTLKQKEFQALMSSIKETIEGGYDLDLNGVLDAYMFMINTILDKICKEDKLNATLMYQAIEDLQKNICKSSDVDYLVKMI